MTTYQFGNSPVYVSEGQTVRFRFKAPDAWDTTLSVQVQIGLQTTIWYISTIPEDYAPDSFYFTTLEDAEPDTLYTYGDGSRVGETVVTVSGLSEDTEVGVALTSSHINPTVSEVSVRRKRPRLGGQVPGEMLWSAWSIPSGWSVANTDILQVRLKSNPNGGLSHYLNLGLGTRVEKWTIETKLPDPNFPNPVPDFGNLTNQPLDTDVYSNIVQIQGMSDYGTVITDNGAKIGISNNNNTVTNSDGFTVLDGVTFVESSTQYNRLTVIAEYLKWFSSHVISRPSTTESKQIDSIEMQIKSRRPSRKGRNKDIDRSLDDVQLEALFEVIRIGSEQNPFTADVQRRNRLIVLLLYHLGLRGGELLNIKVSDIDFSKHQVKVLRRADERDDPRVNEPNVKTLERTLPISETLSKELHDYVTKDRRKVPNATRNSFLFVTHKSGPTVGQPISKSGYHKIMHVVKAVSPKLYALTGHKLRHTWNRKFSAHMDSMDNPPSEERQEQIRSYLMGWKTGSGSAAHYNKRFRQEQAKKAALELQENSGTRLPKDLRNDE